MTDLQAKKDLVRRFFDEVWTQGKFDFIDETYTPDFRLNALWQNTSLGGSGVGEGGETAKKVIGGWRGAMPDMVVSTEDILCEGDYVVSRHLSTATHQNDFMGMPATGKFGRMPGIVITRVTDDLKIAEAWTCWDIVSMLTQLGLAPGPEGSFEEPAYADEPRPFDEEAHRNADPEETKRVVREFYDELWTKGNLDRAEDYFAPDFVGHAPGNTGAKGPEGVRKLVGEWREGMPDMEIEIHAQHAEGSKVGTRFTGRGTHTGAFLGIPPTGKEASLSGIAITRVVDGKVVSDWGEFDMLGMLQQLGLAKPPGQQQEEEAAQTGA
jgi:steroid delta-isomerase-like uncharacterized protein